MKETYYSHGKLLLTGEYVVLDGALALAFPTKYGQTLEVRTSENSGLHWKSLDEKGNIWFQEYFDLFNFHPSKTQNPVSSTLSVILQEAKKLNPNFAADIEGIEIKTRLDFPRNWGLGSSSTLINNLAQWSQVNAFSLLANSFGGSGYDIAAAQNQGPIFYKIKNGKPEIKETQVNWNFKDSLFFVHLNEKQDSKQGIAHFKNTGSNEKVVQRISEISTTIQTSKNLTEFQDLLEEHELLISDTLQLPTVKERLFKDYPNGIKSLGAWGGDFILALGNTEEKKYFQKKGYRTIIPFSKMIL